MIVAEIWGHLAVHESMKRDGNWVVTHVPTGMRLKEFPRKEDAVGLVAKIRAAGLDLDFERVVDCPQATKEGLRALVPETRGVTITVKIEVR